MLATRSVSHRCSSLSRPAWISTTDETEMEPGLPESDERSGGALNAALANELGKIVADFTGRGATRSRAFIHQDIVVCLFEDGATRGERTSSPPAAPSLFDCSETRCSARWGRS
jgi:hypothetical protein